MTQDAVVTKLVSRHVAEVEVERGTACGGTCESCEACVFQNRIRAEAVNKVSALPGQKVVIESKTSDVLGAAAAVSGAVCAAVSGVCHRQRARLGRGRLCLDWLWFLCARRGVQCRLSAQEESQPHYF